MTRRGIAPDERTERRLNLRKQQIQADLEHSESQQLGWRDGVVLSWSAMRGVVTLAAAQSISTDVPYRSQIVLIAFFVAIFTLLLHGLTLPAVIRWLWPEGVASGIDHTELAALGRDLLDAGVSAIDDELTIETDDPEREISPESAVDQAKRSTKNAIAPLQIEAHGHGAHPNEASTAQLSARELEREAYVRLSRIGLEAQRSALHEERAIGRYSSKALRAAELALDAHETRVTPHPPTE